MRLRVARPLLRQVLRWTQRALFAGAVVTLGYCGFVLLDAWAFQRRAGRELDRRLDDERAVSPATPEPAAAIGADGLIGRIDIPRLGLSAVVFEGTDKTTLRHAVGHVAATALPGRPGNTGLAGHRDSFFRPLKDVQLNDFITLTTLWGAFRYRVVSTQVVKPTQVSVLHPTQVESLTLVTCYPFYFVGAAPDRFIVRAERIPSLPGRPSAAQ